MPTDGMPWHRCADCAGTGRVDTTLMHSALARDLLTNEDGETPCLPCGGSGWIDERPRLDTIRPCHEDLPA